MGSVRILKASAGSGKTYQLAYEYVRSVVEEPFLYRHILAVTFTNKATEEMKQRIVGEINSLAEGSPSPYLESLCRELGFSAETVRERAKSARTKILHDYSHFAVLTIDKFFQRIIRSFIKELGIDLNFNLELQTDNLLGKAADQLIDDISVDAELRRWITEFVEEKIEENRKWDIKTELVSLGKELFKENYRAALRTSADTSAASKRQLEKIVFKAQSEAREVTGQMQKMASEALAAIASAGLCPEDFAAGKTGFTSYFVKTAAGETTPYGKRVQDALASDEKWYAKTSPRKNEIIALTPRLRPLLEGICGMYDQNIRFINSAALLKENYRNFALLADLTERITQICTRENIMPISETNSILHKLIAGNDTPFIFEKAGNHFSRFMIDEFQDTSAMQWENFVPLLQNAVAQSEKSPVLLVGDVKQSIYRWRGGDWQILAREVEKGFSSVHRQQLDTNYRSLRTVVEFNNRIVAGCVENDNRVLNEALDEAAQKGSISAGCLRRLRDMLPAAYEGHAQRSKTDKTAGYIDITQYRRTEPDGEAIPPVIERIEQLQQRGYSPSDIAILVRYNAEGVRIANMLLDHKSRHPESPYSYNVVTAEALTIGTAPVAGFAVACLKLAANPDDAIQRAVYNRWQSFPLDRKPMEEEAEFIHSLRLQSPLEAFEKILIRYRLADRQEDIAYIQALHEQLISFCTSTIADIPLFLKWWEETGAAQSVNMPQSNSAITIITVHKAKGLQYKAVLIPYCNWPLDPKPRTILWADGTGAPFEGISKVPVGFKGAMGESYFAEDYFSELVLAHIDNINTFYVATTRAEEELHIMMPEAKRSTGRISSRILESIAVCGETATLGDLIGTVAETEATTRIQFGTPLTHREKPVPESVLTTRYPSRETEAKVRLRLPAGRYFEEAGEAPALSPRNYGILMHRIFENAASKVQIEEALCDLRESGTLTAAETETLGALIRQAFENETIREWFSPQWETVRNENEIIVPGTPYPRRPDRVMVSGRSAVVVDYKFGLLRAKSHRRQIGEYMDLLRSMGYTDVRGYLWYVSLDDVEEVE